MANDDEIRARGGLLPVGYPQGNYRSRYYQLTTGAAAANIFIGMPMDLDANGRVVPVAGATTNTPILGPCLGFTTTTDFAGIPSAMTTLTAGPYLPGNTDAWVQVADDPDQIFVLQEDTGGSALTQSNIGNSALFVYRASSGDTTTGYATAELDRSSVGTGTDGNLMILGLLPGKNSDGTSNAYGNYSKLEVQIYNHRLRPKNNGQAI